MKRFVLVLFVILYTIKPSYSFGLVKGDEKAVTRLLTSQVKYANKADFNKFISTYDKKYVNSDGFDLATFSTLVKEVWSTYGNIKYGIKIKNININGNTAVADIFETSYANITLSKMFDGELKSEANTTYYLEKINGKWKVVSDSVLDETTSMLYGDAKNLDIKLTVPEKITPNTEYSAMIEFIPPKETIAIASLAADKVEYPQQKAEEVFRAMPDDNVLERLFTSNNDNADEYVVASIGLTRTSGCDLNNIRLSLTGFGYTIKRVNVVQTRTEDDKTK